MMHFLGAIAAFALHLAAGLALMAGFVQAYVRSTPHEELDLIRRGNVAAAIGLGGAVIGYAIVLSRAITYSDGLVEVVLWGLIGLAVQVGGHVFLSRLIPRLYTAIEEGDSSAAVAKAALAITLGLISAASMTP